MKSYSKVFDFCRSYVTLLAKVNVNDEWCYAINANKVAITYDICASVSHSNVANHSFAFDFSSVDTA